MSETWSISNGKCQMIQDLELDTQDMIDRYFETDDISVKKISDDYYEENV